MDRLFCNKDLSGILRQVEETSQILVERIPEEQFLHNSDDQVLQHVLSQCELLPIELHEDKKVAEQCETKIEKDDYGRRIVTDGLKITVTIPWTGTRELWRLCPSHRMSVYPFGLVTGSERVGSGNLEIVIQKPTSAPLEAFNKSLENILKDIRFYLQSQETDIEAFNAGLPARINRAIHSRREKLKKHADIVRGLNIPLKKRDGAPDISKVPIRRKLVRPLPPAPNKPAEPGISTEDYEHILSVIRHEGRTFEATPATYAVHDEEGLRDIILAHLNGHYQGEATGETFRRQGKTDIRIEDRDRAAFVAECKVWRGPSEVTEALDQLLGYLTWRDCKTALVIFNKHVAGFTEIQEKAPGIVQKHPNFEKSLGSKQAGEWRFVFHSKEDPEREVIVHVFLFNLYVGNTKKDSK